MHVVIFTCSFTYIYIYTSGGGEMYARQRPQMAIAQEMAAAKTTTSSEAFNKALLRTQHARALAQAEAMGAASAQALGFPSVGALARHLEHHAFVSHQSLL